MSLFGVAHDELLGSLSTGQAQQTPTCTNRPNNHSGALKTSRLVKALAIQIRLPVAIYLATAILTIAGAVAGISLLSEDLTTSTTYQAVNKVLVRWDSEWYVGIAAKGYSYDASTSQGQNVAFFPVYPMLMKCMSQAFQLPHAWSGIFVAHFSLLLACVAFHLYLKQRFPGDTTVQTIALFAFALAPAGFFWRFGYSESTFLLLVITSMYLMHRRTSLGSIALLIGLATATRPVGVALLLPFFWHIIDRQEPVLTRLRNLVKFVPLACWGLLAYMVFQYVQFGEPLAFAKTQTNWRMRPEVGIVDKAASYAALEPIWSAYYSDSYWYWNRLEPHAFPPLSLAFWNPIAFAGSAALVFLGFKVKWLKTEEAWLAVGLLAIPYFTRGFDFCMLSQARFSSIVFPAYITLGHLLKYLPRWLRWVLGTAAVVLFAYFSARFAAGFRLI